MKLCLILLSTVLLHTQAKSKHTYLALLLCSDRDADNERIYGLDGEETWHADFTQKRGVDTWPQFADPEGYTEETYESAVTNMETCKQNLALLVKATNKPAEPLIAPQTSLYSRDDVQLGSQNTLICYVSGFYPAHVTVSWTKNNVKVTNQATLSRHYTTSDGTFNLISHLNFTPADGDIYTCTVEHAALSRPLTKTWDVQVALPGVGPSVYCGVGLAAGLLGVAVGTFFLLKGNNCN